MNRKDKKQPAGEDDFKETFGLSEEERWKYYPQVVADEISELLEINLNLIRENYKMGAPSPTLTLNMKAPEAGDMPKINVKISIPKLKGSDERDIDLNQPRWFQVS